MATKPKKKTADKKTASDWGKLCELIAEYAEAYVADSWKGGGDPADFAEIELRLKLQTERLNNHITKMQLKYS